MKKYLALGTKEGFDKAKKIYVNGIYSHPLAKLQITNSGSSSSSSSSSTSKAKDIEHGNLVIGLTENHKAIYSTVSTIHYDPNDDTNDDNTLVVAYDTSNFNEYIPCEVGGNPHPFTEGCFKTEGSVIIENHGTFDYKYDIIKDNNNGISLYGFSEHVAEKMFKCKDKCPYPDYEKFYKYYGQLDYGDLWITAAFDAKSTSFGDTKFDRGNVDFTKLNYKARAGT